jgi:transposase
MSENLYVGIDVAKDSLVVASAPAGLHCNLPNTPQGHRRLLKCLQGQTLACIVVEATGGYERDLIAFLLDAQLPVRVVNPRQVRDYARADNQLAKTDALDAEVIARFAQAIKPPPRPQPTPETVDLAELVSRRRQLLALLTQETNRLPMVRFYNVRKSITKMIKTLQFQIKELDQLVLDQIQDSDELRAKDEIIRSVPGVGPQTSAMLLAHLPELGRLNRQEIAALAGLAPWDRRSGSWIGQAHIGGGRPEIRSVLYMAALTAYRCNPVLRQFALRLKAEGKAHKVFITACMRKLLVILNTMIRNHQLWHHEKTQKKP